MDIRYTHFEQRMTKWHPNTWANVHEDCRHALFNWLVFGWEPGGFLTAVLTNDLWRAAAVADTENTKRLAYVTKFVMHAVPLTARGTLETMRKWHNLSDRERETVLIEARLLPTLFEVIKDPLNDPL